MDFKQKIKSTLKQDSLVLSCMTTIYNHLPFNNSYSMHGNKCHVHGAVLHRCKIKVIGRNNKIVIKNGCGLRNCRFIIHGNNNTIELSQFVFGNHAEFYMEDDNNRIFVSENTTFTGKIHLACIEGSTIKIGKDCLFSSDIVFRTGDSHSILDLKGNRINPSQSITIGNHVWIGHKALINKGVAIADNSVIGTGAIVTKEFSQQNVAIAGVPAKVVKENINWLAERISTNVDNHM